MPVNHPEDSTEHSEQGESLKSRKLDLVLEPTYYLNE
jgi:hypothetical protein